MSYPIWWEQTVTVYNKCENADNQIVTWYKTVIPGCFWKYTGDKITVGNTVIETNTTICRIPKQTNFLAKYQWASLPDSEKTDFFTLGSGDIIVKGEVEDGIDEYTAGLRSTDLLAKYKDLQGCIVIEEVAINTGKGRCNEHYYVKGV